MGNVGGLEVLVVLLVALVVLGPEKLPEAVRKVGQVVGEFRRVSKSFQDEMRSAAMLDDIGLEASARQRGEAAVEASKDQQAKLEPTGRSLDEGTEPFVNTGQSQNEGLAGSDPDLDGDAAVDADLDADAGSVDGSDDPRIESDS